MTVGPIAVAGSSVSQTPQTNAPKGGQIELPRSQPPSGPLLSDILGGYLKQHDAAASKALDKINKTPELRKSLDKAVSQFKKKYPNYDGDPEAAIRKTLFNAARQAAYSADPDGNNPAVMEKAASDTVAEQLKDPDWLAQRAGNPLRDPFE